MFDTHCHLNFKAFKNLVDKTIKRANETGISLIVVPGSDIKTSEKAIEIANQFDGIYASCGIHPHHIYKYQTEVDEGEYEKNLNNDLNLIESMLSASKVVAVGEVGVDKYYYKNSKYSQYQINEKFIELQVMALKKQINLAKNYDKALILHNRLAGKLLLDTVNNCWDEKLRRRAVFHCCEEEKSLLDFAVAHDIFVGVDGDVTFSKSKQEFVKKIPLDLLVVETDSPYLLPEPLKSQKKYPNEPANLVHTIKMIADLKKVSIEEISQMTTGNGKKLFKI